MERLIYSPNRLNATLPPALHDIRLADNERENLPFEHNKVIWRLLGKASTRSAFSNSSALEGAVNSTPLRYRRGRGLASLKRISRSRYPPLALVALFSAGKQYSSGSSHPTSESTEISIRHPRKATFYKGYGNGT